MSNIKKDINFAIKISTYRRSDGKTPFLLNRAIKSIFDQTYKNFKIFLMGDKYDKEEEVREIISKYDKSKIIFENLTYAKERDRYSGRALWCYGGVNAVNIAIEKALNEGFEYLCHLDHDDWWYRNHLEVINKYILEKNADFVFTKSTHLSDKKFLPVIRSNEDYIECLPRSSALIHSSTCINFKKIPIRYRDLLELTGAVGLPADADMWERARDVISEKKLNSGFINILTCRHDEQGFALRNY